MHVAVKTPLIEITPMRKTLALTITLTLAVAGLPLAFAATGPQAAAPAHKTMSRHMPHHAMHSHWRDGHGMLAMGRQLDLSKAQRANIHQLMRENFKQARPQRTALHAKRLAFANATPGTAAYQNAANHLAQAEAEAKRAQVLRRAALRAQIYHLLTPAQRTQLTTLRAQRQERMQWMQAHRQHAQHPAPAGNAG